MSSLLARGQAALTARLQTAAVPDGAIVYHRGAQTCTLTGRAWVGRTGFRVDDRTPGKTIVRGEHSDGKSRLIWSDRDYLFAAEDLVVGGVRVEPAEGDWIEEVLAEGTVKFRLWPYNGEPAWRYSDHGRTRLRLHTKRWVAGA